LLHIFDRGYASGPWLRVLESWRVSFVSRWKKGLHFFDANGHQKKLWQIGQGKKYRAHLLIRNPQTGEKMPCDLWWAPVRHAEYGQQLSVVKARVNRHIWDLLTNERVHTEAQAWEIFFAYRRRWQIETSFRYGKSELAMESPRLWSFENRLKLLGMVTLVYAFLLHLLTPASRHLVEAVLRLKCHRTGKWCQEVIAPLYRVRWALSRLWDHFHPLLGTFFPPNLQTVQALASFRC